MSASPIAELDSLSILVIIDNEIDAMSPYRHPALGVSGQIKDIGRRADIADQGRGSAKHELRMDNICCGAHGLSLMVTAVQGSKQHTVLFDTGPEEEAWERNARRLRIDIGLIEAIILSHWHRDHSGGMLRALSMTHDAERDANTTVIGSTSHQVVVDRHPSRPDFRGSMLADPVSMEADPTFEEIERTGARVAKSPEPHALLEGMFLVSGEIPRVTAYEKGLKNGIRFDAGKGAWEKDELVLDERFLVCNLKGKGLVLFTGCSHGGVINAAKHAITLTGGNIPLYAVIGGFHLVDSDEAKMKATVEDFVKLNPTILLPGHCSGWRVKFEIEKAMPGRLAPCTVGTRYVL